MPVAEALASGLSLALSPAILAHLLRCLADATIQQIDPHQNGPLWVFQLWLQTYFVTLRPDIPSFPVDEALGLPLASKPVPPHQAEDVFKYLFGLEEFSDDEFLVCRRRAYPSFISLPIVAWGEDENCFTFRQNWGSFVLTLDLPLGCDAHVGQVGKFITHISCLGSLGSFKAVPSRPCSPLQLSSQSRTTYLVPRRRNAGNRRKRRVSRAVRDTTDFGRYRS